MNNLENRVEFPPVTVKLHWPDRWCSYCLQECVVVATEIYHCPSCDKYTVGKNQFIESKVRRA